MQRQASNLLTCCLTLPSPDPPLQRHAGHGVCTQPPAGRHRRGGREAHAAQLGLLQVPAAVPLLPCSAWSVAAMHRCNPRACSLPAHPPRPTPPFVRQVTTASVACGVLGVGGNKGAVAVEFSVHRRKIAVVCSHFAAHQVRWLCRALRLGSVGWDGCMGATFMSTGEAIPCPRFFPPTHPSHPHTCWSHPLLPPAGCGGGA